MDAGWYEVGQPQLLDFLFYVKFEINVHIWKGSHLFFACFLRLFFPAIIKSACLRLASVERNNTGSWQDCDQFPGQTCGLGGICVLCGLEISCLFPISRGGQAVVTTEVTDSRNLDYSLNRFQSVEYILVRGGVMS